MLTAAQQLYERSRREGKLEGQREGDAEMLRRQLEHRLMARSKPQRRRLIRTDEAV